MNAVLHPYYKLEYIESVWGGEKEREMELALGVLDAKNWRLEASRIFESAVSFFSLCLQSS